MFPKRLREARKAAELTLEEFAEKYNQMFEGGMNKSTVSKYENDRQNPAGTVVANIAEMLGVTTDYLLGKTDWKSPEDMERQMAEWESKYNPNGKLAVDVKKLEARIKDVMFELRGSQYALFDEVFDYLDDDDMIIVLEVAKQLRAKKERQSQKGAEEQVE